jgi:hypothetical protein
MIIICHRYYAICLPLRASLIWTKGRAGLACAVSWLLSLLLTAPVLAMSNYSAPTGHAQPTCSTDVDTDLAKERGA